jgi:hypothetical protein
MTACRWCGEVLANGRMYCDKRCCDKSHEYRRWEAVKAVNATRVLIAYFTCVRCGKLGVHKAQGRNRRQYHIECARLHRNEQEGKAMRLKKARKRAEGIELALGFLALW